MRVLRQTVISRVYASSILGHTNAEEDDSRKKKVKCRLKLVESNYHVGPGTARIFSTVLRLYPQTSKCQKFKEEEVNFSKDLRSDQFTTRYPLK